MSKQNIVKQEILSWATFSAPCPGDTKPIMFILLWKLVTVNERRAREKPTQKLLMKRYLRTIAQNSTESWLCKFEMNLYHLGSVIWNL